MESVWKDGSGQTGRAVLYYPHWYLLLTTLLCSVQIIAEEKANGDVGSLSAKFKIHEETEV